jgi:hypothetical protein
MTDRSHDSLSTSTLRRAPDAEANPDTAPAETDPQAAPNPADTAPPSPATPEHDNASGPETEHTREHPDETVAAPAAKTKVRDRAKAKFARTARRATDPARRLRAATRHRLTRGTAAARVRTGHLLNLGRTGARDTAASVRHRPAPWAALVILVTATAAAARRHARR